MAAYNVELRRNDGSAFSDLFYTKTTWAMVDGKPSTYTPTSHNHTKSEITDFPTSMPASDVYAWAKAASKPSYTYSEVGAEQAFSKNTAFNKNFGTASGTVCQGNDSRLTDARTPVAHAVNASTYGYGDGTNAGHLRIGEGISVSSGTISLSNHGAPVTTTSSTTLSVASHNNRTIILTSSSSRTITVPTNSTASFAIGTHIDIIRGGTGEVTISPASGVTLYSEGSKRKINDQYQAVTLIKTATDAWLLIGALKS